MPLSILIVDDSEYDQLICRYNIESLDKDISILQAYDGQEALDILAQRTSPPDIILLDINMPRMDGFAFLEHFKTDFVENSVAQNTRIAMLSSSINERDKQSSAPYPFVENILVKPITTESLNKVLNFSGS
jgi:CheY-like chemotaxis protein